MVQFYDSLQFCTRRITHTHVPVPVPTSVLSPVQESSENVTAQLFISFTTDELSIVLQKGTHTCT